MTRSMRDDDPMRHSGARWCEEHGRWECSKNSRRTQGPCHGVAIGGMPTCRMHAGVASSLAKAQGDAKRAAWSLLAAAEQTPLDPGQAVMHMLTLSAQRVEILGELLRLQLEDQDYAGLVGVTHAAGREGQRLETGEQVRALAKLEADERDRLVKYAKTAHDMGIAQQQIQLEQAKAQLVVTAFLEALRVLGLVPADRDLALRTFLQGLGRGPETTPEVEAGGAA